MTINIELSPQSVYAAIRRLKEAAEHLEWGVGDTVETLAKNGADVAKTAYGHFEKVHVDYQKESDTKAVIQTSGKANIIAEFGAGYATMEYHPFAAKAPVPIKVASYSESTFPRGLFFYTDESNPGQGFWFFHHEYYDRVQPKHGLLDAYDYIMQESTEIATEVIKL